MEIYGNTRKKFLFLFFYEKWKYMVKKYFFYKNFLRHQIIFSESMIMNFHDRAAAYGDSRLWDLWTGRPHFTYLWVPYSGSFGKERIDWQMLEMVEKIAINGKNWKPGPLRSWSARSRRWIKTEKREVCASLNRLLVQPLQEYKNYTAGVHHCQRTPRTCLPLPPRNPHLFYSNQKNLHSKLPLYQFLSFILCF